MDGGDPRRVAHSEMAAAWEARAAGHEGRARVCARRAAAAAIAGYLRNTATERRAHGAVRLLQILADRPEQSEAIRLAAHRLTVPVTPEHTLPHPEDPLADAELILRALT
jgi:hypothetical protein